MSDYFLNEAWKEVNRLQTGNKNEFSEPSNSNEREWPVFIWDLEEEINKKASENERVKNNLQNFQSLLAALKNNCLRYFYIIEKRIKMRESGNTSFQTKEERKEFSAVMENIEKTQMFCHNAIVDTLNALSRLFLRCGLDNRWRLELGDRDNIGFWAYDNGRRLSELEKKQ